MTWSPRQLADLAGVSVKAVRYYHHIGVLDEPARAANGYRQYTFDHLLRLLQIKRLTELGVPLAHIPEVDRGGGHPLTVLREAEVEISASIERLQRVRSDLLELIEHAGRVDVPAGFGAGSRELSDADRSMLLVWDRVLDDRSMDQVRRLLQQQPRTEADDAFDALRPDAADDDISHVVDLLAPHRRVPPTPGPTLRRRYDDGSSRRIIIEAIAELYNPAQREVLRRLEHHPN